MEPSLSWYFIGGHRTGHFTGSFFFVVALSKWFRPKVAVGITLVGMLLLEVYQWLFEPYYKIKALDTALDIPANILGVFVAYQFIKEKR